MSLEVCIRRDTWALIYVNIHRYVGVAVGKNLYVYDRNMCKYTWVYMQYVNMYRCMVGIVCKHVWGVYGLEEWKRGIEHMWS
jgi:hypothetical protein